MNIIRQTLQVSKTVFSIALTLELSIIAVQSSQVLALSQLSPKEVQSLGVDRVAEYIPPAGMGTPPTSGGGTRSPLSVSCPEDKENKGQYLTALVPTLTPSTNLALTVAAHPQFFVYMPETSARTAEFVLKDENENDVYRQTLSISGSPEIVNLSLPKTVAPLKIGKNYHWYFSLVCNPGNRRRDVYVDGWSQRTELSPNLAVQLQKATPSDRPNLYAQAGIWHEALSTLADLCREAPNAPTLAAEWKKLLESAGLKQIADLPIVLTASGNSP